MRKNAAEVGVAMGVGYGGGGGAAPATADSAASGEEGGSEESIGAGGVGGGGGSATARPVAVITIGPAGVNVEPIIDPTKLGLALFTAIGGVFVAAARMRKFARQRR